MEDVEKVQFSPEVNAVIKESALQIGTTVSKMISEKLSNEIIERIKPFQESELDYLKAENARLNNDVYYLNLVLQKISNKNIYCLNVVNKSKIIVQNKLFAEGKNE